jgi:hypothetical protein
MTTPTTTKTTRKPRPAAKTGNPAADRAVAQKAEDAKARQTGRKPAVHIAAVTETPATDSTNGAQPANPAYRAPGRNKPADHEYVLVNGEFQVHLAGCADVKKALRESDYAAPVRVSGWLTTDQAVRDLWSDIIAECEPGDADLASFYAATHFAPCVRMAQIDAKADSTPAKASKAPAKPAGAKAKAPVAAKTDKRAAKQDLGNRVVLALAAMVASLDGSELALSDMTKAEAAQCVANWIHHVPVTRATWPTDFPTPDRSDWR